MPASTLLPKTQTLIWDRTGTPPAIADLILTMYETDSILFAHYTINFENTSVEWLWAPDSGSGYIDFVDSSGMLALEFQDLSILLPGNYKSNIVVELSSASGVVRTLTSTVNLQLTGNAPTAITTDKPNYNVLYNRETNVLSGETHVGVINNIASDVLTLETIGTLFNEVSFTDQFDLVEDPAFPFVTNSELPTSGTQVVSCKIRKAGVFVYGFTVTITVINSSEIIVAPESLEFLLRKGFNETKTETLVLTNPLNLDFTITKPSWLNLSASSGGSSANIVVETINSDTLNVGELNDYIEINYDSKTIQIPVKLTVIAFIDINSSDYNFCLDKVILKVFKMNETARFVRVTMKMKFKTQAGENESESVYQIPYFENKVNTDIGEKVQNFFPVFQDHLFETDETLFDNQLVYKAAAVQLIIEEIDINYLVLRTVTIDDLDFYAGNKPVQFPLFTNFPIRRKYSGSTFFFSYFTDLVTPIDFTGTATSGNPTAAKEIHAVKLISGGILNETSLKANLGVALLPFPNVQKQTVLQYLNNNLVPQWLILSGTYKITDDFEHITDDFQLNAQKYDTSEKQKLTISTGFILKEESQLVKEVIKSKISFILLEDIVYKAFCVSSKLVELESDQTLISYELEFLIVK